MFFDLNPSKTVWIIKEKKDRSPSKTVGLPKCLPKRFVEVDGE